MGDKPSWSPTIMRLMEHFLIHCSPSNEFLTDGLGRRRQSHELCEQRRTESDTGGRACAVVGTPGQREC